MLLKKNKVEIIKGEAFFNDKNQFRVIDGEKCTIIHIQQCNYRNR